MISGQSTGGKSTGRKSGSATFAILLIAATAVPAQAQETGESFQYLYGSAEGAAITRQSFNALVSFAIERKNQREAGRPLTQVVLANGSSLDRPAFESCGNKPLAAVFDVDETILLNIGFQYWDAQRPADEPFSFKAWDQWEKTGYTKVVPLPGALEAAKALRDAGVAVIYNTNRTTANAELTARALEFAGFDKPVPGRDLFTDANGGGKKDARRAAIAETYCVIALGGDQMGDFSDLFDPKPVDIAARRAATAAPALAALWGQGWFVMPNSAYGKGIVGNLDTIFPDPALRWTYSEGQQP